MIMPDAPDSDSSPAPRKDAAFHTTQWTEVLSARGTSPTARVALSDLCATYYEPVLAFLRREGRTDDQARELAHAFFAKVLGGDPFAQVKRGRGRFRSYLLGALKHFLSHDRERGARLRRGGGAEHVSLPDGPGESSDWGVPDPHALPADVLFDQRWAMTLLDRALTALERECRAAGEGAQFERYKPWLTGDADRGNQAQLAVELGLSPSALKSAAHRLKARFRLCVRAEVARTLANPADTDQEMEALFAALNGASEFSQPNVPRASGTG